MTPAEINGMKMVAQSMSVKDLEWQIHNAKKLGVTDPEALKILKDELTRKKGGFQ